jgi:hypothetical protein
LLDLLQPEEVIEEPVRPQIKQKVKKQKAKAKNKKSDFVGFEEVDQKQGGVNKWLIAATIVVSIFTFWFFIAGPHDEIAQITKGDGVAKEFQLKGTPIESHIHTARMSKQTLFGIVREDWKELTPEAKKKLLEQAVELGKENGFQKVMFLNSDGKSVGYGSPTRVTVY